MIIYANSPKLPRFEWAGLNKVEILFLKHKFKSIVNLKIFHIYEHSGHSFSLCFYKRSREVR